MPVKEDLKLESIDSLKAGYFCERREVGVINVAGPGAIIVDGREYKMDFKDAIYIGKGSKEVTFKSQDASNHAHFYIN